MIKTVDEKEEAAYIEIIRTALVLLKRLASGSNQGKITQQIPLPTELAEAFNGNGLFVETK